MFLEERLTEKLLYGSTFSGGYDVDASEVRGGKKYKKLMNPYPTARIDINLLDVEDVIILSLIDFFNRVGGMFGGFRARHPKDYSTNNYKDVPTYNDQKAVNTSGLIYQITRWFGDEDVSTSTRRRVLKPVADTVLVGIRDDFGNPSQIIEVSTDPDPDVTRWTVDITTGLVTFAADSENTITGITQASQAVITLGAAHGRVAGDSIHISTVAGMTEINGLRAAVLSADATTVTVDIDSTLFTAYTSGGVTNTAPQSGEVVTAGCYYDIPCEFETDLNNVSLSNYKVLAASISIAELLDV